MRIFGLLLRVGYLHLVIAMLKLRRRQLMRHVDYLKVLIDEAKQRKKADKIMAAWSTTLHPPETETPGSSHTPPAAAPEPGSKGPAGPD